MQAKMELGVQGSTVYSGDHMKNANILKNSRIFMLLTFNPYPANVENRVSS